jgi:hypothetical protein
VVLEGVAYLRSELTELCLNLYGKVQPGMPSSFLPWRSRRWQGSYVPGATR